MKIENILLLLLAMNQALAKSKKKPAGFLLKSHAGKFYLAVTSSKENEEKNIETTDHGLQTKDRCRCGVKRAKESGDYIMGGSEATVRDNPKPSKSAFLQLLKGGERSKPKVKLFIAHFWETQQKHNKTQQICYHVSCIFLA